MTIEIRCLTIKSYVQDGSRASEGRLQQELTTDTIKKLKTEVLRDCRGLIRELLAQANER